MLTTVKGKKNLKYIIIKFLPVFSSGFAVLTARIAIKAKASPPEPRLPAGRKAR
jgi:hypothetical protein